MFIKTDGASDLAPLLHHPAVERFEETDSGELSIVLRRTHTLNDFLATACASLPITSLRSEPVSLHDVFVDAVRIDDQRNRLESGQ